MGIENQILNRFNYGIISKLGLARRDLERMALGAEEQTNIIGRIMGAGRLRPGLEYISGRQVAGQILRVPFIKSINDTAILEFQDNTLSVRDETQSACPLVAYEAVAATIPDGNFEVNTGGWTSADEIGAFSGYPSGGFLLLRGTNFASARRRCTVAINPSDYGKTFGLRV